MDSILFCTKAQKTVIKETIQNCWSKTSILPTSIFLEDETVNGSEVEESDFESEKQEVQELLDKYYEYCNLKNYNEKMNANEFISIDDNTNIEEVELIDEAIINLIKSNEIELEEQE